MACIPIRGRRRNLPASITSGGIPESYSYDADGTRVKKVRQTTSTYYFGGLYEEEVAQVGPSTVTTDRYYYTFNGQTIAQQEYVVNTGANTLKYLHGDQLGSVSLVTSSTGASSGTQEFDPWGKVRSGGSVGTQTTMNFTGQKLDGTGLLNYNARMYDPVLGRFERRNKWRITSSPYLILMKVRKSVQYRSCRTRNLQTNGMLLSWHGSGSRLSPPCMRGQAHARAVTLRLRRRSRSLYRNFF
jgi:RHS repeat-associated protein